MADQAAAARGAPGMAIYAQLAAVVLFWGTNWLIMKAALPNIGAFTFNALRMSGSALLLAALLPVLGAPWLPRRGERTMLGVIGFLQVGGMLGLSTLGLQSVPPGRAAVLVYTMQIWALPLAFLIARERPSGQRIVGGALAFAGVLVFFNPALMDWSDHRALFGNGLLLTSAVFWATAASLYRRRVWRTPFWTQTFWQIAVSAVVVVPMAPALDAGHPIAWTPTLIGALVYNWLVGTALCYWWWSKALAVMPAAQAGQIVCLVPITALLESALIFGEPLSTGVLLSVGLIAAGIVITARAR
ncbi:DMT family transporter [Azospirillum sp. sgz301742]